MIEPLRSQYLAALGIDNYVPRFVLPGAKLSAPCAWLDVPAAPANQPAAIDERASIAENAVSRATVEPARNAPSENAVPRAPIIETAAKRPQRADENIGAKLPAAALETGPRFALSVVLADGGILLIDAAPASSVERSALQRLLDNMLPALRPAAARYAFDIFLWPLTKQPKIQRDAAAAKETLAAYLHKQIQQRAVDVVLLLGETAQQWCVLESDVRVVRSSSLLACVKDPALKRPLWNDIRHLAER